MLTACLKTITILLICCLSGLLAYGQSGISGKVISAVDKQPIASVSISLQNKNIGTVTNDEGKFTLVAPLAAADSLAIDYLGYKSQHISLVGASQHDLVIQLDTLIQQLKEVTIKPLTLPQLLDSIVRHNQAVFLSPMKLNGYYREFVFTNDKCTEYSDALVSYFRGSPKLADDGQLKIIASRCAEAKADNKNASIKEFYIDSKIPPNKVFQFAMLGDMLDRYFPADDLAQYQYKMEGADKADGWVITVLPKPDAADKVFKVVFNLDDDFTLRSYRLEIPANRLGAAKQKSLLGIHVKVTGLNLEVDYARSGNKIYPKFYKIASKMHIWGKFLGTAIEQTYNPRSEYVTTDINTTDLKPFPKNEVYKKGNICTNGTAINDALLKEHNFIAASKKDSLAISGLK